VEEVFPCEGDLLVVRKLLESQPYELEQSQREKYLSNVCAFV